jgi:hypothetical protein
MTQNNRHSDRGLVGNPPFLPPSGSGVGTYMNVWNYDGTTESEAMAAALQVSVQIFNEAGQLDGPATDSANAQIQATFVWTSVTAAAQPPLASLNSNPAIDWVATLAAREALAETFM